MRGRLGNVGSGHQDEIGVVEAIYGLSLPNDVWIRGVSERVADHLGADLGVIAAKSWRSDVPDEGFCGQLLHARVPTGLVERLPELLTLYTGPDLALREHFLKHALASARQTIPADHPYHEAASIPAVQAGAKDSAMFAAFDGLEHGLGVGLLFSRAWQPSPRMQHRYQRLAQHAAIATRLRSVFSSHAFAGLGVETQLGAVFDPTGRCHDAFASLGQRDVRARLAKAVRAREKALSSLRQRDPDQALELCQGIMRGEWSLVGRTEADGRRFVLAVGHEACLSDPRALTVREQAVAERAGRGATNQEIASDLGISEGAVSAHLHRACRKLQCENRATLIRLLHPANEGLLIDVNGLRVGAIAEPPAASSAPSSLDLTCAERDVLAQVRAGRSNRDIASARGTTVGTVAKQVAAILRKKSCASRYELML